MFLNAHEKIYTEIKGTNNNSAEKYNNAIYIAVNQLS